MKKSLLSLMLFAAAMPMAMSDPISGATTPTTPDPLAADKAALAAAQQKLAADQAAHDENQKALDAATESHAAAHIALQNDQAALAAAQEKLAADQAALDEATAAHAATVAAAAAPVPVAGAEVPAGATVVHESVLSEAEAHLDDVEAVALKWGGDVGTDLRNLVGKLKTLFGLSTQTKASTQAAAANVPETPAPTGTDTVTNQ
jgi:DNA repair exonuclease SbcCD ATPase subunit